MNDSLLSGALVVDAPGAPATDRIFVLERWNGATRTAINGKSWPFTERLTYKVGERVHWRVINGSDLSHPMHLHGSHFNVDAVGDGERYQTFADGARPLVFTQTAEVNDTFEMTWTPHEPGRWLYHCHRQPHMRIPVALDPGDALKTVDHEHAHDDAEYAGMGGMIMGITVTGRGKEIAADAWKRARKLELEVGARKGEALFYELAVHAPGETTSRARGNLSPGLMGPPIVLTQNQPVEISVINKLKESTAIHWHGIELESYYDGVPGWGGLEEKKTPAIEPGQTFVARMVPSRAGTFIYHTHWHDNTQLTGGVHGPLIVMPPGRTFDPATDKPFLFSQGPNDPYNAALLLMNGVPQPNTMQLRTGTKYRLRFINITPSVANLRVSLRRNGTPVQWRPIARDAVDLPAGAPVRAELQVSVGETYDFEYEASSPQELTLEGIQPNDTRRVVQTLIFTAPPAQAAATQAPAPRNGDWPLHNLDLHNSRYAPLDEINTSNVARLAVTWSLQMEPKDTIASQTPLVVDGVMYFNAGSKLFAVDAGTGKALWTYTMEPAFTGGGRGPVYGDGVVYAYGRSILYAVDAKTGRAVESFGNKGSLSIVKSALEFKYPGKFKYVAERGVRASPLTYSANGTQYVAVVASNRIIAFGLP